MKKKFFRPCFALLLSMVLLFGGVRWDAVAIGDVSPFGVVVPVTVDISYVQTTMQRNEHQQLNCAVAPSGGTLSWTSSSPSVATVSSTGYVTAVSVGTTTITARYTYNGAVYTDYVTIQVLGAALPVGIEDNTDYYLVNYSSGRVLGVANTSDANLTNVQTVAPTNSAWYQWTTELQSDGRFQLINEGSPTDKCLDLSDVNIDIYTQADRDCMKFTIQRVTSGDQAGLYLIKYGNNFVVEKSDYNVAIQSWYTPGCYWSFMPVEKGYAEFFYLNYLLKDQNGNPEIGEDGNQLRFRTDQNRFLFESVFEGLGYTASSHENANPPYALNSCMVGRDDIFVYTGHGSPGRIVFYYYSGNVSGVIASKNLPLLYEGSNSVNVESLQENALARLRMVIYMGCETGVSYNYLGSSYTNLVDETFEKGAHFVLGTTEILLTNHTNDWLEYFFDLIGEGLNVGQAVSSASFALGPITVTYDDEYGNEVENEYDEMPLYCRGDQKQYFNIN